MSYTPDLKKTEWWHDIAFAYSKSIPEKFTAIMVGWIGNRIPPSGKVSNKIIEKLEWTYDNRTIDQGWLREHECGNKVFRGVVKCNQCKAKLDLD